MEARMWNKKWWLRETTPDTLKTRLEDMLNFAGFSILKYQDHHFNPQGFTVTWLLGESHLAVHTFPEAERSYVELSSCNWEMYVNFIEKMLAENLLSSRQKKLTRLNLFFRKLVHIFE